MVTKKAFQHFNGIYELECTWTVTEKYHKEVIQPEINKMMHTKYMAEFMFKCTFKDEKPLSKKDYGRTRYTHNIICDKIDTLYQIRTDIERKKFSMGIRKLQIEKGLYPFKTGDKSFDELIEEYEELKLYYEEGKYKKGSFVDRYIAHISKF